MSDVQGSGRSYRLDLDSFSGEQFQTTVSYHWDPYEDIPQKLLDQDRRRLLEWTPTESGFDGLRSILALFGAGEEAVTEDLTPLLLTTDDINKQLFLAAQIYEEAKHIQFFDRYWRTSSIQSPKRVGSKSQRPPINSISTMIISRCSRRSGQRCTDFLRPIRQRTEPERTVTLISLAKASSFEPHTSASSQTIVRREHNSTMTQSISTDSLKALHMSCGMKAATRVSEAIRFNASLRRKMSILPLYVPWLRISCHISRPPSALKTTLSIPRCLSHTLLSGSHKASTPSSMEIPTFRLLTISSILRAKGTAIINNIFIYTKCFLNANNIYVLSSSNTHG